MEKNEVIEKFQAWIDQKPGLDWYNYCNDNLIKQEYKHIAQQKNRAIAALSLFAYLPYNELCLISAENSFSGRLKFNEHGELEYCTGQYWPTKYRLACAVVLESYIWDITRIDRKSCMLVFKYYGLNVKSLVKRAYKLAHTLRDIYAQNPVDYDKRNKILDKIENEFKYKVGLYDALIGLAYQYKCMLEN